VQSPHDKLFQFAFRMARHAVTWVHSMCPVAMQAGIDWRKLQPAGERIPGGGLRAHFADAIFRAPYLNGEGEVWFVIEHKSYPDPGVHWQLLQYVVHLRRGLERKPADQPHAPRSQDFVGMVLHHGDTAFAATAGLLTSKLDRVVARHQPRQRLLVDDLTKQGENALRARHLTPLATLVLLSLQTLPHLPPEQVCRAIESWADLMIEVDQDQDGPVGSDAIDAIGYYALAVTEVAAAELSRLFAHILDRPDTTIMSTLEHTFQKGKAAGQAEGQAAGQAEGQAKTILRMLELRFGAVAEDVRQTVLKGSAEQLDKWTDRVLAVSRPEDLVAD
jgi:hypothetical protein